MSPFKSKKQMRYLYKFEPKVAKRWAEEYGVPKNLPEKKRAQRNQPGMSPINIEQGHSRQEIIIGH